MPTVVVNVDTLWKLVGKELSKKFFKIQLNFDSGDKEFEDLCFEFGIELEDVVWKETIEII